MTLIVTSVGQRKICNVESWESSMPRRFFCFVSFIFVCFFCLFVCWFFLFCFCFVFLQSMNFASTLGSVGGRGGGRDPTMQ